ncbi:Myb family protein-like protein [Dorcoceras hygrometricum]|uniref:Myb family protein-like protein n=1 Tax=Dorcoceras hygrometricum TaxID=472368 RepID=A0A2Z7BZV1_9LAMI|nr:Myb family protein-like protein [Dorcoceras hygrometricum]
MDENNRRFFRNFISSTKSPEENVSSQNSQIPPNLQYPEFSSFTSYLPQVQPYPFVPMYPRAPYPMHSPNYWQNTNNPYLTPSTYYGYHNPQPNDSPMEKKPATATSVPETQLSKRETPIDLEHLDKVYVGGEGKKKRSNWSKAEDESGEHMVRTKKTRTSESGASNTSSNQDLSIDLDAEDEETRPIEYDLKQKQLEVEEIKEKDALARSEAKNRAIMLREYEILNKDTSQMSAQQLIIHERLYQDIRERWNL